MASSGGAAGGSSDALAFLQAARTSSPFALGDLRTPRLVLRELEEGHRTQLAMHLEKHLKSIRVLREMGR